MKKSLRFHMLIYIGSALLVGTLLSILAISCIDSAMIEIMDPQPDALAFVDGRDISIIYQKESFIPAITDPTLFQTLKIIRSICPAAIFSLCFFLSVFLFYKRILKKPLETLQMGIDKISRQELNFSMKTDSENELGALITAFEMMRRELAGTFQSLWKSEENQRSLYRAFAHDLRTPLTIIKGSNDNIEQVAVKNKDWPLVLRSTSLSSHAADRIELYAGQLKELEHTEDLQPHPQETDLNQLTDIIRQQTDILSSKSNISINLLGSMTGTAKLDADILLRILDNLTMNALQYANHQIWIQLSMEYLPAEASPYQEGKGIKVSVRDDGAGFQPEAMKKATAPFYTTQQSPNHLGIGLTISQILLQKTKGQLSIENIPDGGACVSFRMMG